MHRRRSGPTFRLLHSGFFYLQLSFLEGVKLEHLQRLSRSSHFPPLRHAFNCAVDVGLFSGSRASRLPSLSPAAWLRLAGCPRRSAELRHTQVHIQVHTARDHAHGGRKTACGEIRQAASGATARCCIVQPADVRKSSSKFPSLCCSKKPGVWLEKLLLMQVSLASLRQLRSGSRLRQSYLILI